MQQHLDRCRIFHQYERVDLLHTHTDNDFLSRIRDRAETEGITAEHLRSSPDAYRVYVAARFVSHVAMPRLRREIDRLYGRCLEPREAWKRVRKLVYCYNEKAKRMAMDEISHLDTSRIFIAALKPKLQEFLTTKLCDDHPMCRNSSYALSAAIQYQEEVKAMRPHKEGSEGSETESDEAADKDKALVAASKKTKKRGKRTSRKERKERRKRKRSSERTEQAASGGEDGKEAKKKKEAEKDTKKKEGEKEGEETAMIAVKQTEKQASQTQLKKEFLCHGCKQPGHFIARCPQAQGRRPWGPPGGQQWGGPGQAWGAAMPRMVP